MTFAPINSQQAFLSPTIDIPKPEDDPALFYEVINQRELDTASIVNLKENAVYNYQESLTNQQWPTVGNPQTFRDGYRIIFNVPAIAAGASATIPHGLSAITQTTHQWAEVITNVPDFRHVPYASVTAIGNQIEMRVDTTNIYIFNGSTAPAITGGFVIIEYLKN